MSKTILLATHNLNKIKEIEAILATFAIKTLSLHDFPDMPEVEEDGQTFAENALKKARAISSFSGLDCLADDSGLLVDALNGLPGVYSARYAGEDASDEDNNNKLLEQLQTVPLHKRQARFECTLALVTTGGQEKLFSGTVPGKILLQSQGDHGFGYDPLFVPDGYEQTFGVLAADIKNRISHRARALVQLVEFLREHENFLSN